MTKTLFNVQNYIAAHEGKYVAEHVNILNKIISYLLSVDMKLDEHDKTLIFLAPFPPSYNYLVATIF